MPKAFEGLARPHATLFLGAGAEEIEVCRRRWDPEMARQIAAHVTLVYPEEAPDPGLLVDRLEALAPSVDPFRLALGETGHWGDPANGVFVHIVDVDRGWSHLRERVLSTPFHPIDVAPHVTLV